MKIGFFIPRFEPSSPEVPAVVSGGTMYDLKMVEKLTALGHRVNVIDTPLAIPARELDMWARQVDRFNFDVLVQDELGFEGYAKLNHRLDSRGNAVSRVGLTHVPTARLHRERGTQQAEYTFLTSVHWNVFVSHAIQKETERLLGPVNGGVIIPPGVDHLPAPPPSSQPGQERPFGYVNVGHFLPHKGQLELLDVLAKLPEGPWRARLIGRTDLDAAYTQKVLHRCSALGLDGRVECHGELTGAALSAALAQADVFMACARYESFGIAIAEAAQAGVPVVGWTEGGPWDFLHDNRDAIKTWPGDKSEFVDALHAVRVDKALYERLREGARDNMASLPTWDASARAFECALQRLLDSRAHLRGPA
ncbi:MAG: glycosyltransferase family 4 protein [Myxococcaceae bacterium]|nr:glycosyltransferase family 4 protein [Myxococcaceae bacterium]